MGAVALYLDDSILRVGGLRVVRALEEWPIVRTTRSNASTMSGADSEGEGHGRSSNRTDHHEVDDIADSGRGRGICVAASNTTWVYCPGMGPPVAFTPSSGRCVRQSGVRGRCSDADDRQT